MKKLCSLLILLSLLLISVTVFAYEPVTRNPIFLMKQSDWIHLEETETFTIDPNGDKKLIIVEKYYTNLTIEYGLSIYIVFEEVLFKKFVVYEWNGKPVKTWYQVELDGKLFTALDGVLAIVRVGDTGKIYSAYISLKDDNGNEIVRREVKRK